MDCLFFTVTFMKYFVVWNDLKLRKYTIKTDMISKCEVEKIDEAKFSIKLTLVLKKLNVFLLKVKVWLDLLGVKKEINWVSKRFFFSY